MFSEGERAATFPTASAEVGAAGAERADPVAGLRSAFPGFATAPDPAPNDEPAVFDAAGVGGALIDVD